MHKNMMESARYICLDTETTGSNTREGHRIIDIGCVEIMHGEQTGNTYQAFIHPERDIDAGAQAVHGISIEFLKDKPKFAQIKDDFLKFIEGAVLVIHNAPFDVGFLNYELSLCSLPPIENEIIDSLTLARKRYPGEKASLDALCKKFEIDTSARTLHGALTDARLLAQVFIKLSSETEIHARQTKYIMDSEFVRSDYSDLEMVKIA